MKTNTITKYSRWSNPTDFNGGGDASAFMEILDKSENPKTRTCSIALRYRVLGKILNIRQNVN